MRLIAAIITIFVVTSSFWSQQKVVENPILRVDEIRLTLPCRDNPTECDNRPSIDFVVQAWIDSGQKIDSHSEIKYSVSGGKVIGTDRKVDWDLTGARPGSYKISVEFLVNGVKQSHSAKVTVEDGICICDCECPKIRIRNHRDSVKDSQLLDFDAVVEGSEATTYNWTIEGGEYVSGQGTKTLRVRAERTSDSKSVRVTVSIGGLDPICRCPSTATSTVPIEK